MKILKENINNGVIHIINDETQINPDGWDYPVDELDYLIEDHPGETFVLAKDEDGEYRLWETIGTETW